MVIATQDYTWNHPHPTPCTKYLLTNDTLQGRKGLHLLFGFFQGKKDFFYLTKKLRQKKIL